MSCVIDTTKMECPNGCLMESGFGLTSVVPRQFKWVDGAKNDVGTRNYCERCGTELVESE